MEPATGPDVLSVTHSRPGHRPNFRRVRPARAERGLKDRRQRLCQASSFARSRGPRCAPSMTKPFRVRNPTSRCIRHRTSTCPPIFRASTC